LLYRLNGESEVIKILPPRPFTSSSRFSLSFSRKRRPSHQNPMAG
jgi:hypothetical protein